MSTLTRTDWIPAKARSQDALSGGRMARRQLRDAFSRRHALVNELVGEDASRDDRQRAAHETRRAKVDADASGMRSRRIPKRSYVSSRTRALK
ncbi:hypothetical protein [Streptomyces sp. NPDC055036]